ncbi:DUF350 domain-containing protein [Vitreoscilla massiliensis]|uniref:DUF350 domain-containing protein n=1 Tax=Vitreoscilla massiliensis TaxID=1689272 RepID=A0ABY4E626_9NEIS|nr:DUF350 domain-containing protein [Vitreoscilla massiliensis]UOO90739.1 DUF350 domain-containing protein [Vitreoscilla massiliensis]
MDIAVWQYLLYLKYFGVALVMLVVFAFVYLRITPARELELIKNGNIACALSLSGAMIGFCITLVSSMLHSVGMLSFVIWGVAAAVIQILVYFAATHLIKDANAELLNNNVAVGVLFFGLSVSIGILNAASLS